MRIIIDTETTGLEPARDEIIELAIISADTGEVLLDRRYGAMWLTAWPAAQAVNHISPDDVAGLPPLGDDLNAAEIIESAEYIAGWNLEFDLRMLARYDIRPAASADLEDIMQIDARIVGEPTADRRAGKWRKLTDAAASWQFVLPEGMRMHSGACDCLAALHVLRCLRRYESNATIHHTRDLIARCRRLMGAVQADLHSINKQLATAAATAQHDDPATIAYLSKIAHVLDDVENELNTITVWIV